MTDEKNIGLNISSELPYNSEKKVEEDIYEKRNFEVCQPKESITKKGIIRKRTKRTYVHLKERDEQLIWSVLEIPPEGEPEHYQFEV